MPRASAAPGAGLRKAKKVKRSSGRTAGERSVAKTYAPVYRKRMALNREYNRAIRDGRQSQARFNRDLEYLSTLPQFSQEADQTNAEALIRRLQELTGNKGYVDRIVVNDDTVGLRDGAAATYMPFSGGQISIGANPAYDIGTNSKDIKLTKEQISRLSPRGKRFVKRELNSPRSKRDDKESKQTAKNILMHEYAHAMQFANPGSAANPDWFIEGAAELKARKLWKQLHPNTPIPNPTYDNYVKKVKKYRKRYGKGASPYKRSDKILGVPLDPEMTANYLGWNALKMVPPAIGDPIWDLSQRIGKLFG